MDPTPPSQPTRQTRLLLGGVLLLMAGFGCTVASVPLRLVQPVISLTLGAFNLLALVLLMQRAREPGPEQRGWRLLALSFLGILASNAVLLFTLSPLIRLSAAEVAFFGLQVAIALLQAWAFLSWPFRFQARRSQRLLNLLGSLIFAGSLFLLLWTASRMQHWEAGQWPVYFRMMGLTARVAIVGGVTAFILAEDPRRSRGPMGWFFAAAVAIVGIIVLVRPYLYDAHSVMQPSALFGLVLSGPLAFGAAAWLREPVEVATEEPRLRLPMVEVLLYLPFIASGGALILSALRQQDQVLLPLMGFMVISGLLLARQFLLLWELRRANERLEERVLDRTRSLEELQRVMLRTERLNSVGALGAGLTHDLNNALGGIRAQAELARMKLEDGEPTSAQDLDRILVATDQSATLTSRIMAFARQEEEAPGPLDLAEEVARLESLLRMLLHRAITLKLDLEDGPLQIRSTRVQIEQILVNLVGNARDAMPKGGQMTIRARREEGPQPAFACLEVSDSGLGMTPEVLARLFQPFYTTKPPGRGTGLGLASVKCLVEDSGGSIEVHSKPDAGTRFRLKFPLLS